VLHSLGWSQRAIARALGVSQPAICKGLRRARQDRAAPREEAVSVSGSDNAGQEEHVPWATQPLEALLVAAFRGGARLSLAEGQLVFHLPPELPPELHGALRGSGRELSQLLESRAAPLSPCQRCGNRLWWRGARALLCATCTPPEQGYGPDWVWCEGGARW
jgi:hypothetical protein